MVRRPIESARTPDESFIDRHIVIVEGMARRYARMLLVANELEDVTRTGVLGLVRAAATFKPHHSSERFWAWFCVRREILSAYAAGKSQHTGSDAWTWATCRRPLSEAEIVAIQQRSPEADTLPDLRGLTHLQQRVIELIYADGLSESAIARQGLLGCASHPQSKRPVPINRRRIRTEHIAALEVLKRTLTPTLISDSAA